MKSVNKILLTVLILLSVACYSQDNTVFITSDTYKPKKDEPYNGSIYYTQVGFCIPIVVDPEKEKVNNNYQDNNKGSFWDQFTIDGISLNAGAGYHFKKWAAIGINTGFDIHIRAQLAAVPVYGTITLNPHFGAESSFILQYGYGHVFALGRGDLSGPYSKYKLGVHIDDSILIYADVSVIDLPVNNFKKVESFSIGIDLMNFF